MEIDAEIDAGTNAQFESSLTHSPPPPSLSLAYHPLGLGPGARGAACGWARSCMRSKALAATKQGSE